MDPDKILDVYIHDYLVKRSCNATAKAFQAEAEVSTNHNVIETPGGFLFEWWSVFWDTFIARYICQVSSATVESNNEQQREETHQQKVSARHTFALQNSRNLNSLDDVGPALDPDYASILKAVGIGGQFSRHDPGGTSRNHCPIKIQKQIAVSAHDINSQHISNLSATGADGSMIRLHGSNQGVNNVPLKGWPLMQQLQNSNEQQYPLTTTLVGRELQNSNSQLHQHDNLVGAVNVALDASISNTSSRGNDHQAPKNQIGQKRKQPMSSSCPATSAPIQLADMDCFVENGSFDDNVESFLSTHHHDANPSMDPGEGVKVGFTFSETGSIHLSAVVDCCDFSSDGKLLVTGGNDKKAKIWYTDSQEQKATLEEHFQSISDTRFSPNRPWLATSSLDKTVRVWNVENPGYSIRTFSGHSGPVMSLDFHPKKGDLICSCDEISEIRYWSVKSGGCAGVSKGGASQVRFQPSLGRYLAAVVGGGVSIVDVETAQICGNPLKDGALSIQSISWDSTGERLASVHEDSVRIWKVGSGGAERKCIHELTTALGKRFRCCIFHPSYPSLLVIGCYESLELWNMDENKMTTRIGEPISALAQSDTGGLVASASSRDNLVKIWK